MFDEILGEKKEKKEYVMIKGQKCEVKYILFEAELEPWYPMMPAKSGSEMIWVTEEVVCDETNNTPETIANNELHVTVKEKYEQVPHDVFVPAGKFLLISKEEYADYQSMKLHGLNSNGLELLKEARDVIRDLEQERIDSELVNTIKVARRTMHDAFVRDPDFLRAYHDNIAMRLYDYQQWHKAPLDFKDKDVRDELATQILDLIFN
jgi:hypothetical protein